MNEAGYMTHVQDWELLLAEINPLVASGRIKPDEISPDPYKGSGFIWSNVSKSLIYNTNLVSRADLPRTRADLADPRYRGRFAVAPWVDEWLWGLLIYPKEEWLNTADRAGANAVGVLTFAASLQRLLVGELPLTPTNSYTYWEAKSKDPNAPIGLHWFADYTAIDSTRNTVVKGTPHPAAATLFALWMTTPEAQGITQSLIPYANLSYGQSEADERERSAIKESGSRVVTWYDTPQTLETFKWLSTPEGRAYSTELSRAVTQRR
jgi:ABC-type Fe3+ transport system substrate-binding protein